MFCSKCGQQLSDTSDFCTTCGTKKQTVVPITQAPIPQAPIPQAPIPQAPLREGFQVTKPMVVGGIGVIAMVLAAIGSVLPWVTASAMVFSVSKGGLSGDGIITIILSVLGLGLFAIGITGRARWAFISGLIAAAIILAVSIYDAVDVTRLASGAPAGASVTVGVGLVLCIIGGVIGLGAGVGGIK